MLKRANLGTFITFSIFCTTALAQSDLTFMCTQGDATRVISIHYPTSETVPCRVNYQKNGANQSLWQAQNSEGFCEEKARAFVEKHRSWGWQCTSENIMAIEEN